MADIRIKDLPLATGPTAPTGTDEVAIDGLTTRKTPISVFGDVAIPVASQAEAETGTNASKRMTPLTTKQSIASEVGVTLASAAQGVLASTSLQPGDAATPAQGALAERVGDTLITASAKSYSAPILFVTTQGRATVGDSGGGDYRYVASEPWHTGKFQSADGKWWELMPTGKITPEQFGAFGATPQTSVASTPDDTSKLQDMFNYVGFYGVGPFFAGGKRYKITSTLYIRITRQQATPLVGSDNIFFSDKSSVNIDATGTGQIVAGAAMGAMLYLQFNNGAVNGVTNTRGPDASRISGFILDGNGLASGNINSDYTRNVIVTGNCLFGATTYCVSWIGSAVTYIYDNNMKAPECISCKGGFGGDLYVGHNQYFFPSAGGTAIRVENGGNITINGGTVNGEGISNVFGVYITTTNGNTVRHVKVKNMEWSGCQAGVYARAANTNSRIYGLLVEGNHTTSSAGVDRPSINPGVACDLQFVDEFVITTINANSRNLADATESVVLTRDCRDGKITDVVAANYNGPAWYCLRNTNVHWSGGTIRDVGKSGASGVIVDFDNSQSCSFNPNSVTQSNNAYAQNGVFERTGSNLNTSDNVVWSGVSAPSTRIGTLSRFRRYATPFAEALVSQNGTTASQLSPGYNIASVARASTGRCTVTFTESHSSGTAYLPIVTGIGCLTQIESPTTASIVVLMTNLAGSPVDSSFAMSIGSLA